MSYKPASLSLVWDFALMRGLFEETAKVRILIGLLLIGVSIAAGVLAISNRISPGEAVLIILLAMGTSVVWFQNRWSLRLNQRMLQQQFALQHLQQLGFKYPLPFGRWSVSPDLAEVLMMLMLERKPKVVLELGSGTSTVILGYCAKILGECRVISLDHQEKFVERTCSMLKLHGVTEKVAVVTAPLKVVTVGTRGREAVFQWYDLSDVPADLPPIDLLIVDGPPGKIQPLSRYPALPILIKHLSTDAVVILDDGRRAEEAAIARMWVQQNADFNLSYVKTFDGAWVLTRGGNQWVA